MKKIILIIVLAVFGMTQVQGQDFSFGAKAGLNLASLIGKDVTDDFTRRISFQVGAVARIGLSETLAIQPELLYSAQGATAEVFPIVGTRTVDLTTRLDYINLPIMLDVIIANGLSLQVGPQLGFNIRAEDEFEDGEFSATREIVDVNTLDIGAGIGTQYTLESGLFFQARYTIGFTDTDENFSRTNSVIGISAGFFF